MALAPTLATAAVLIVFMGAASIGFIATANASLQLGADPAMRGRVMALYAMAFLGTTPIGAPLVGAIAQWTDPRVSLLVGAVATVLSAGILMWRHQAGARRGPGHDPRRRPVGRGPCRGGHRVERGLSGPPVPAGASNVRERRS